jgi:hypothetical protein
MASKVSKRSSAIIKGILEFENGILQVKVEDIDKPFSLSEFAKEFFGLETRISFVHAEELD